MTGDLHGVGQSLPSAHNSPYEGVYRIESQKHKRCIRYTDLCNKVGIEPVSAAHTCGGVDAHRHKSNNNNN